MNLLPRFLRKRVNPHVWPWPWMTSRAKILEAWIQLDTEIHAIYALMVRFRPYGFLVHAASRGIRARATLRHQLYLDSDGET